MSMLLQAFRRVNKTRRQQDENEYSSETNRQRMSRGREEGGKEKEGAQLAAAAARLTE